MKKIITSICLIALVGFFVCSIASADEKMCGTGKVTAIRLYESNIGNDVPIQACDVAIRFTTENNQTSIITATAFGTQLNLALLRALNSGECIEICLTYRFIGGTRVTFIVNNIAFPCGANFPVMTIQDAAGLK